MKKYLNIYINSLITNMPVAVFFFAVMFAINIAGPYDGFKAEFGMNAIDALVDFYFFYFTRTIIFTFIVSFYGMIFLIKKLKYNQMILIHAILTIGTVVLMFNHPANPGYVRWIVFGSGIVIYGIIWFFVIFKERQFLKDANKILNENK